MDFLKEAVYMAAILAGMLFLTFSTIKQIEWAKEAICQLIK